MGLRMDLEKACVEGLGPKAEGAGNCPKIEQ